MPTDIHSPNNNIEIANLNKNNDNSDHFNKISQNIKDLQANIMMLDNKLKNLEMVDVNNNSKNIQRKSIDDEYDPETISDSAKRKSNSQHVWN